jgi:hypothetical protein
MISLAPLEEAVDWVSRARVLIPRDDRKVLLSPPRLVSRFARFALRRSVGVAGQATADDVRARDPELVSFLFEMFRVLAHRYFRLRVEGIEHVPATGPACWSATPAVWSPPMGCSPRWPSTITSGLAGRSTRWCTTSCSRIHSCARTPGGWACCAPATRARATHSPPAMRSWSTRARIWTRSARSAIAAVVLGGRGFLGWRCAGVPIVPVVTAGIEQFIVLGAAIAWPGGCMLTPGRAPWCCR